MTAATASAIQPTIRPPIVPTIAAGKPASGTPAAAVPTSLPELPDADPGLAASLQAALSRLAAVVSLATEANPATSATPATPASPATLVTLADMPPGETPTPLRLTPALVIAALGLRGLPLAAPLPGANAAGTLPEPRPLPAPQFADIRTAPAPQVVTPQAARLDAAPAAHAAVLSTFLPPRTSGVTVPHAAVPPAAPLQAEAALVPAETAAINPTGRAAGSAAPVPATPPAPAAIPAKPASAATPTATPTPAAMTRLAPAAALSQAPSGDFIMMDIEKNISAIRPVPMPAESMAVRITEPIARDLGLRDGQVIQGLVEQQGGSVRLLLNDQAIQLPPGLGLVAGDTPMFRLVRSQSGLLLLQLVRPSATGAGTAALVPGAPAAALAAGTAGTAAPLPAPAPAAAAALSPTILALLARPPGAYSLAGLLAAPDADPGLQAALAALGLPQLIWRTRPSMATLSAGEVGAALATSGLFTEAILAAGDAPPESDLKITLRRLQRAASAEPALLERIDGALADIESAQLQALQATTRGDVHLSFVLPFADAPPLHLDIERRAPSEEEPAPPFTASVHSSDARTGEVWLRVAITPGPRADLTMWALKPEVSAAAAGAEEALGTQLAAVGVTLGAFTVYTGARPDVAAPWSAAQGRIIDLEA